MDSGVIILAVVFAVLVIVIALATRRASRKEKISRPAPSAEIVQPKAEEAVPAEAPAEEEEEEEAPPADEERKKALKAGLAKTRGGFIARMGALLTGKKTIDAETMDQLEEVLVTADIGVKTAHRIFGAVKKDLTREQLTDADAIWAQIRRESEKILDVGAVPIDVTRAKPFVILIVGVN